jgi:hypothetical protein
MPFPLRRSVLPASIRVAFLIAAVSCMLHTGCGDSSTSRGGPVVDPTFSSSPPASAEEGKTWSYTVAANDPSGGSVSYTLKTAPDGASLSGATVTWKPTHAQSRVDNSFVISAKTSEGGSADQSFTVTPNGIIQGTAIDHAVTGSGIKSYPEDLSRVPVTALIPDGNGGFNVAAGSGDNQGNFSIPNVPAGSFWLQLPQVARGNIYDNYIWTSSSDVDAGSLLNGRGDAVRSTRDVTVNTNVNLGVPPASGDTVRFASPDLFVFGGPGIVTQPLTTFFLQAGDLIDGSKGDRAFLAHYQYSSPVPLSSMNSIVEAKEYDSITETSGGSINLTGTMSPVGGSTIEPVISVTQFDALFAGLQLGSALVDRHFYLYDSGYDGSEGFAGGVSLLDALLSDSSDSDLGSLTYGTVTSNGVPYYTYQDYGRRQYVDGFGTWTFSIGSVNVSNVLPSPGSPITPVIGLVQSPLINGVDFYTAQDNLPATPTISWSSPTLGTATFYTVSLVDITGYPFSYETVYLYTDQQSVTVPPNTFQPGEEYVIEITATYDPVTTFSSAPFREGPSLAYSTTTSGAITIAYPNQTKKHALATAGKRNMLVTAGRRGRLQVQGIQ